MYTNESEVPREKLVNITVVTDNSWDNVAKIMRRIDNKCIKTSHRINLFYGKNLKMLQNVCLKKGYTVFRRSISNKNYNSEIKDILDYTKFCIIFHNFTEYNTISECMINLCNENCIPYFIISEHTNSYYFNGEYIHSKKFKNCIKEISHTPRNIVVSLECNPFTSMSITTSTSTSTSTSKLDPETSIEKFMDKYSYLQELKKINRTILIA
jgi:hypothetical protein